MASILGRYGQAREDGFFKNEQEADIQDLRKRMLDAGKFDQDFLEAAADVAELKAATESCSPVLMEVLQASARVSIPDAAKRRVWELRKAAGLPPLPDAELVKAIRRLQLGSAALDIVPTGMTLSPRTSWNHARKASDAAAVRFASRYEQTPEQKMLAQRQLALGLRTAAYGTMLTTLVVAGGVTAVAWRYGLRDWDDCKAALRAWGQSYREPLRAATAPLRDWGQHLAGRHRGGGGSS